MGTIDIADILRKRDAVKYKLIIDRAAKKIPGWDKAKVDKLITDLDAEIKRIFES